LKLSGTVGTYLGAAFALALAGAQPAPAATLAADAEHSVGTIDVQASAVLNVDAAAAWRVLTDYDHHLVFVPDLRLSHVLAHRGARSKSMLLPNQGGSI